MGALLFILGVMAEAPINWLLDTGRESARRSWSDRAARDEVENACREAMISLFFAERNPLPDLKLPASVRARLNHHERRSEWAGAVAAVLSNHDGITNLALMLREDASSSTLQSVREELWERVGGAIDPEEDIELPERLDTANVILLLVAYHLDPKLFERFLTVAENAARQRKLTALAVADRIERPADAIDVDAYLDALVDALGSDLPTKLGIGASTDQLHRRLDLDRSGVEPIDAEQVLDQHDHVLIVGDPGAGKSWIAQRLALAAARRCQEQRIAGMPVSDLRLPVFARCAAIEQSGDFFGTVTRQSHGAWPDPDRARRLLSSQAQSLLVVLDSYDESTGDDQLRQHLQVLVKPDRDIQVVLTSRPGAVPANVARLFDSKELTRSVTAQLLPMTAEESAALRRQVAEAIGIDPEPLDTWLVTNRRQELTKNPLLSVLCVLAASGAGATLPLSVPELYDHAIAEIMRREARTMRAESPPISNAAVDRRIEKWMRYSAQFAREAMQELEPSLRLQLQDSIPVEEVDDRLNRAGFHEAEHRVVLSLTTIDQSGYRFLHRTIHEHLIARHAAESLDETLERHFEFWRPWDEIASSTIVQLRPEQQRRFVQGWLESTPPGSDQDIGDERLSLVLRAGALTSHLYWDSEDRAGIAQELTEALASCLNDNPNSSWVGKVAKALVEIGGDGQRDAAATALVSWLNDNPNTDRVGNVAKALVEIVGDGQRDAATAALVSWLTDNPNTDRVGNVAWALVEIGGDAQRDAATTALVSCLNDPNRDRIHHVAWGLVEIVGDAQRDAATTALVSWLKDNPNSDWVWSVARALVEIGGDAQRDAATTALVSWLKDNPNSDWIDDVAWALVEIVGDAQRDAATTALVSWLKDNPNSDWVRIVAMALVDIGGDAQRDAATTALVSCLNDPNSDRIDRVARALVEIVGDAQRDAATTALVSCLNDPNSDQIHHVARALVEIVGDAQRDAATTALVSWLKDNPNSDWIDDVAWALVEIGGDAQRDAATTALVSWLKDNPNRDWVRSVAMALVEIGGDAQRDAATTALVSWLKDNPNSDWIDEVSCLNDPNSDRIDDVAWALVEIGGDAQRDAATTALVSCLNDPNSDRIDRVARALVEIVGDAQRDAATTALVSWLKDNPNSDWVRSVARALVEIGGDAQRDAATTALVSCLNDPTATGSTMWRGRWWRSAVMLSGTRRPQRWFPGSTTPTATGSTMWRRRWWRSPVKGRHDGLQRTGPTIWLGVFISVHPSLIRGRGTTS